MTPTRAILCGGLILIAAVAVRTSAADTIRLRSGERIADRTVIFFDEDGLRLDPRPDAKLSGLRWDEVESADIEAGKQAAFDQLLEDLGDPLFRIRWRLQVGDGDGLREPAEQVYARYRGRRSPAALLVATAAMWGRLAAGEREAAVEPLLQIVEILRSGKASTEDLPGERRLNVDAERALSGDLLPVWFDAEAAKRALPELLPTIRDMAQPRPEGVRLYYGTLAAAAGDAATAKQMLGDEQPADPLVAQLRTSAMAVLSTESESRRVAQTHLDSLRKDGELLPTAAPLALYALGISRTGSDDAALLRDGALDLLEVAAVYPTGDRELAAAALYQAAGALDKLKDSAGAARVRRELKQRFRRSSHAAKAPAGN